MLDLLRLHARIFVQIGQTYETYLNGPQSPNYRGDARANEKELAGLLESLRAVRGFCLKAHLTVTACTIERAIEEFSKSAPTNALSKQRYGEWFSCFLSELENQTYLLVLPHRSPYRISDGLSGQGAFAGSSAQLLLDELEQFPSARYDAMEACNCFAYERFTAAMYHLMRVTEFGLITTARAASVHEDKISKGWDGCIQGIDSWVKTIGSTKPMTDWQDQVKKYSDLSAWFTAICKGWRNPVSHFPRLYTEGVAESTFGAVRTIFQALRKAGLVEVPMPRAGVQIDDGD